MMKKFFFVAMMAIAFIACNQQGSGSGVVDPSKPSETKELTPEQSKEKLAGVAQKFMSKLNTADQKAAVELAEGLAEKFESYSWDSVETFLYDAIFETYGKLPRYMAKVAKGSFATSEDPRIFIFSFEKWGVIFEADDATKSWKLVGKTEDGSTIFRFTAKDGKACELKGWGEGATHVVEWKEMDYSAIDKIKIVAPATANVLLTYDGKQLIRIKANQDFKDNEYVKFDAVFDIVNVTFATNEEITLNHAAVACSFSYSGEKMLSMAIDLPSYKIDPKAQDEDFTEWMEKNMDPKVIKTVGRGDMLLDIMGEVQAKVTVNDVAKMYEAYQELSKKSFASAQESIEALCKWINDNQTNGLYYNSPVKQAEFRVQVSAKDYEYAPGDTRTVYNPEVVIYFPQDGSTYAVESYFDSKPFTDLQKSAEDLIEAYLRLFHIIGPDDEFHF